MRSNNKVSATTAVSDPSPRLVMAVLAIGMIVGALFTVPNKPTGPAADLAVAKTNAGQSGDSR